MFNRKHFFTFPNFESFMDERLLFELNNRKLLELSVKLSWIPRLFDSFPAKTLEYMYGKSTDLISILMTQERPAKRVVTLGSPDLHNSPNP